MDIKLLLYLHQKDEEIEIKHIFTESELITLLQRNKKDAEKEQENLDDYESDYENEPINSNPIIIFSKLIKTLSKTLNELWQKLETFSPKENTKETATNNFIEWIIRNKKAKTIEIILKNLQAFNENLGETPEKTAIKELNTLIQQKSKSRIQTLLTIFPNLLYHTLKELKENEIIKAITIIKGIQPGLPEQERKRINAEIISALLTRENTQEPTTVTTLPEKNQKLKSLQAILKKGRYQLTLNQNSIAIKGIKQIQTDYLNPTSIEDTLTQLAKLTTAQNIPEKQLVKLIENLDKWTTSPTTKKQLTTGQAQKAQAPLAKITQKLLSGIKASKQKGTWPHNETPFQLLTDFKTKHKRFCNDNETFTDTLQNTDHWIWTIAHNIENIQEIIKEKGDDDLKHAIKKGDLSIVRYLIATPLTTHLENNNLSWLKDQLPPLLNPDKYTLKIRSPGDSKRNTTHYTKNNQDKKTIGLFIDETTTKAEILKSLTHELLHALIIENDGSQLSEDNHHYLIKRIETGDIKDTEYLTAIIEHMKREPKPPQYLHMKDTSSDSPPQQQNQTQNLQTQLLGPTGWLATKDIYGTPEETTTPHEAYQTALDHLTKQTEQTFYPPAQQLLNHLIEILWLQDGQIKISDEDTSKASTIEDSITISPSEPEQNIKRTIYKKLLHKAIQKMGDNHRRVSPSPRPNPSRRTKTNTKHQRVPQNLQRPPNRIPSHKNQPTTHTRTISSTKNTIPTTLHRHTSTH